MGRDHLVSALAQLLQVINPYHASEHTPLLRTGGHAMCRAGTLLAFEGLNTLSYS